MSSFIKRYLKDNFFSQLMIEKRSYNNKLFKKGFSGKRFENKSCIVPDIYTNILSFA